jgi:hypothetical protein
MPISQGGLVETWHRLAGILTPWHEQLKKDALSSAVLHGDETGGRVNGRTHWLWCFGNSDVTMRKNIYAIRSDKGARTQSTLMSIFTTLKQRNANPISTVAQALREYIRTRNIPLLPPKTAPE